MNDEFMSDRLLITALVSILMKMLQREGIYWNAAYCRTPSNHAARGGGVDAPDGASGWVSGLSGSYLPAFLVTGSAGFTACLALGMLVHLLAFILAFLAQVHRQLRHLRQVP